MSLNSYDCPICQGGMSRWQEGKVRAKYPAWFLRCANCGHVRSENPSRWLAEAYASPITASDVGLVGRCLYMSDLTEKIILLFMARKGRFCDWGGGYGLLVRMMRDRGFNFFRYEPYCENLFAHGFDIQPQDADFTMITAFETVEHFVNPMQEFGKILSRTDNLLFSTIPLPSPCPHLDEWWYYGLEHGQHVSLYTVKSLAIMAESFGLHYYSDGSMVHLFSREKRSRVKLRVAYNFWGRRMLDCLFALSKPASLLSEDSRSRGIQPVR